MRNPITFIWRYLIAPFLYPILTLPTTLILFIARPLQLVLILVLTGLSHLHAGLAVAFAAPFILFYGYHVFVPPHNGIFFVKWLRTYGGSTVRIGSFIFTAGLLVTFLLAFWLLPPFNPVARWFASLGLAYYIAGVASGYVTALSMRDLV